MKTPLKKLIVMIGILLLAHSVIAQSTWSPAESLGNGATPRYNACGMSIGNKGYLGTGFFNSNFYSDFFEYDVMANSWSQKAVFAGGNRSGATSFSIGTKGYIGLGYDGLNYKSDFWEYDPSNDSWTQKAAFAGVARSGAVGFSIGSKGYVGTGFSGTVRKNDFWEYDPASNSWTQKANFGGVGRSAAAGFSIGTKGYLGTGYDGTSRKNDFWEFDQAGNSWTQKANFGGTARSNTVSFAIGSKGYIGTGLDGGYKNDFWEYNPTSNTWTAKANFGGAGRYNASGFSIEAKGYIGIGFDGTASKYDFWEYDQVTNSWIQKFIFGGFARTGETSFSISTKAYMGTGYDGSNYKYDLWEYDALTNVWTQKANLPATGRTGAIGFSISDKGYVGTGYNGSYLNDFWEYDPTTNSWLQKANFGGVARQEATGFSIDTKGYVGTGNSGSSKSDFWEYNPSNNSWTQKTNFPGGARQEATGFAVNSKGYLTTGVDNDETYYDDLWEYDPAANAWLQKPDFPGSPRRNAAAAVLNEMGYVCTGFSGSGLNESDTWVYDPAINVWNRKADFSGNARNGSIMLSANGYLWLGFGDDGAIYKNDWWKFNSQNIISLPSTSFCEGASFSIIFNAANYLLNGNLYTAQLSDANGNFGAPITIGTLAGTTSGSIAVTLPTGMTAGSNYLVRITSSKPSQVLITSTPFTINTFASITSCPSNVFSPASPGSCSAIVNYNEASASGMPAPQIIYSQNPGTTFSSGNTNVIVTATNTCSVATCNFSVTVTDKELPTISCPSSVIVNAGAGQCSATGINPGTPATADNCGVASVTNDIPVSFQVGNTFVNWTVTDVNGNTNTCTQTITVNDNQFPVISGCPANIVTCSNPVSWVLPSAADNCGIASFTSNFNPGSTFQNGVTNVTYTATDINGKISTCSFTVTITTASYTIAASGPITFCKPGSVTLTVSPAANTYQWYKKTSAVSGATQISYSATASGNYSCKVTGACGTITSNKINVTANPKPDAIISPAGTVNICNGQTVVLSANTGSGLTYKWQKGSSNISGATNSTYLVSQAGTYKVTVTSLGCTKTSAATTVNVMCKEQGAVKASELNIFPNPTNGKFMVSYSTDTESVQRIQVTNIVGQVIDAKEIASDSGTISFDLDKQPAGIYFVCLKNNFGTTVQRLEIVH
ncbi:MAG: HYR domain-containing protein [Chitinophagales bacterium]